MFLIVEVGVLVLGLLIALIRTVQAPVLFPLRLVAIAYVDVMRGIPTILLVYIIGFAVPGLNLKGVPTSPVVLSGLALAMCYSAYVSEVFRAGLESIHPSQAGAALALGLTPVQALRYVVVPQAVRRVIPPLLNDFIACRRTSRSSRSSVPRRRSGSLRSSPPPSSTTRRCSRPRRCTCA